MEQAHIPASHRRTASAAPDLAGLAARLLAWYDRHRRKLPWRAAPGQPVDPYRVWLSEIMLQQTTVATVEPYFRNFTSRWPTVSELAAADLDSVLHAWQGLGYYARARNLHKCAGVIAGEYGGGFPDTEEGLRALPGVGPYTAAAIAAIAFGRSTVPVDGNVERVMARLFAIAVSGADLKREVGSVARDLVPVRRAGDFWQAVMDLGATVCRPRNPACLTCPWDGTCAARKAGEADVFPRKAPRKPRPTRYGVVFWAVRRDGAILLRRRPERGLLGGMTEIPSTEWRDEPWAVAEARALAPIRGRWRALDGRVAHTFTHFHLEITVLAASAVDGTADGIWCVPAEFGRHALPTVMKKVAAHAAAQTLQES